VRWLATLIEQLHFVPRQGPAHTAWFHLLPRYIADNCGGLGLAVAVADSQAPGCSHALDYFRIERLTGTDHFAQPDRIIGKLLLHEQSPDGRWSAQRRDAVSPQRCECVTGDKSRLVVGKYSRTCIPGRKHAAPGVFGPSW